MALLMLLSKKIRLTVFFVRKISYRMCLDAWRSATECWNLMEKWYLSLTVNKKIDVSFIGIGFLLSIFKFFLYQTKKQIRLKCSSSCSAKDKTEMQLKKKIKTTKKKIVKMNKKTTMKMKNNQTMVHSKHRNKSNRKRQNSKTAKNRTRKHKYSRNRRNNRVNNKNTNLTSCRMMIKIND